MAKNLSTHFDHLANQMDLVATVVLEEARDPALDALAHRLLRLGEGMRSVATHLQKEDPCPNKGSDTNSRTGKR